MTASRVCGSCGAAFPSETRWCTRCYEPVRELTPRSRIHEGDFVGTPVHERVDIPRWTRWESTATTFGPWGRIAATAVVFATLVPGIAFNGPLYAIAFILAAVLLREIWAKGCYLPEAESPKDGRPHTEPPRPTPQDPEPITARRVIRWGLVLAGSSAFAYGNAGIKAGVVSFATIALLVWLWTSFDR
jgi:hypothetical protein